MMKSIHEFPVFNNSWRSRMTLKVKKNCVLCSVIQDQRSIEMTKKNPSEFFVLLFTTKLMRFSISCLVI